MINDPREASKASLDHGAAGQEPAKLVAVAVANKMARIAWAIMAKEGYYRAPELAAAV